jgi:carbonic anhydrase/acetyltransferase-like protein (isoleucine patch superfamily)
MKNFIYTLVSLGLKIYRRVVRIKSSIFIYQIKNQFQHIGNAPRFELPLNLKGAQYITIGDHFSCNSRLRLDALKYLQQNPKLVIKNNVTINFDCHIGCINKIEIGNNVLIASKVYITDHSHGETDLNSLKIPPSKRPIVSKGSVIINDNVWIGEGAIILPNVVIGENSIVGANSVVTKSVPPFSIVAGIPAKVIKTYSI